MFTQRGHFFKRCHAARSFSSSDKRVFAGELLCWIVCTGKSSSSIYQDDCMRIIYSEGGLKTQSKVLKGVQAALRFWFMTFKAEIFFTMGDDGCLFIAFPNICKPWSCIFPRIFWLKFYVCVMLHRRHSIEIKSQSNKSADTFFIVYLFIFYYEISYFCVQWRGCKCVRFSQIYWF